MMECYDIGVRLMMLHRLDSIFFSFYAFLSYLNNGEDDMNVWCSVDTISSSFFSFQVNSHFALCFEWMMGWWHIMTWLWWECGYMWLWYGYMMQWFNFKFTLFTCIFFKSKGWKHDDESNVMANEMIKVIW